MAEGMSFFIDTSKCIACKSCQIACKQWNQRKAEKMNYLGSHQNPPDMSYNTWKLVRFTEVAGEGLNWYFFPDQCRHCLTPPCKMLGDSIAKDAVTVDEQTGAVIYNPKVKISKAQFKDIREACPYDIPRIHSETAVMAKCTMCLDRVKTNGLPACVKTCPTGAMNFGERKAILAMAEKRLARLKGTHEDATLANPDDVRVIFLFLDNPKKYHKFAVAESSIGIKKRLASTGLWKSLVSLQDLLS